MLWWLGCRKSGNLIEHLPIWVGVFLIGGENMLNKDFFHHYQPIVNIWNNKVIGYESLFRTKNNRNPEEIFNSAKKEGKLYELDSRSIHKASTTFKEAGYIKDRTNLFLNVFPSTINNKNFISFIYKIINNNGFSSQQIILEILENELINLFQLSENLEILKEFGVQIAIDDFGKGNNSLRSVIELQPDFIKMDRYFMDGFIHSKYKLKMIESLKEYCDEVGSKLIVEGVEDEVSLEILKNIGVQYAQGYLLGRPTLLDEN